MLKSDGSGYFISVFDLRVGRRSGGLREKCEDLRLRRVHAGILRFPRTPAGLPQGVSRGQLREGDLHQVRAPEGQDDDGLPRTQAWRRQNALAEAIPGKRPQGAALLRLQRDPLCFALLSGRRHLRSQGNQNSKQRIRPLSSIPQTTETQKELRSQSTRPKLRTRIHKARRH